MFARERMIGKDYETQEEKLFQQSYSLLFAQMSWKFMSHRNLHKDVYDILNFKCQTWKQTIDPSVGE